MAMNFQMLKSKLNGKSKAEVEAMIANGVLDYDKDMYTIVESEFSDTLSGYDVIFTKDYMDAMKEVIEKGDIKTYIKLDDLLSQGFLPSSHRVEQLCLSRHDINTGIGTVPVDIYVLEKEDEEEAEEEVEGEEEEDNNSPQATILVSKGKLIKGSYAMVARRSKVFIQNVKDDVVAQNYLMEELKISRQNAAYLVKQIKYYNDTYEEEKTMQDFVRDLQETARLMLYNTPIVDTEFPRGVAHELYATGKDRILSALGMLADSGLEEFTYYLNDYIAYTNHPVATTLCDILTGLMKQAYLGVLDAGIESYRTFVAEVEEYAQDEDSYSPYTPISEVSVIAPIAEVTGTLSETFLFLVKHGSIDDLQKYLTTYQVNDEGDMVKKAVPDSFVKTLFNDLTFAYYEQASEDKLVLSPFVSRDLIAVIGLIEDSRLGRKKKDELERALSRKIATFNPTSPVPTNLALHKTYNILHMRHGKMREQDCQQLLNVVR